MPGYSISDFLSRTGASFVRPNLFEVQFPKTPELTGADVNDLKKISINCHTCSVPGKSIATTERDQGFRSYAYQRLFNDVSFQFYLSEDATELKFLHQWLDEVVHPPKIDGNELNNHVNYYLEYVGEIVIIQYDRQQIPIIKTELYEAYPKEVGNIELGYGTTGSIVNVSATFTYRHFKQTYGDDIKNPSPKSVSAKVVPTLEKTTKPSPNLTTIYRNESNKDFMTRMLSGDNN